MKFVILIFLIGLIAQWSLAAGDSESDADLIPTSLLKEASKTNSLAAPSSSLSQNSFIEDSFTAWARRDNLIFASPAQQANSQNRLSLGLNFQYQPSDQLKLSLSNRLSAYSGDNVEWKQNRFMRNDLREASVSYEFFPRTYLDVGRIDLKFGSAYGYNPTDFFKARTLVDLASIDPSSLKESRLGVGVVSVEKIFDGGSINLAYAPRLQSASPLLASSPETFDLLLGQTNSMDRYLAALSVDLAGINTQALLFKDDQGTHVGVNFSRLLTNSLVVYVDWSGVDQQNLSQRAVAFGQSTGALPSGIPIVTQKDSSRQFSHNAAVGFSWSSDEKLSANLEYHYHQSGFSGQDFDDWIKAGQEQPLLSNQLWYIRQYAADQQEPFAQQQIFIRFEKQEAFIKYLNLGSITFLNSADGSSLTQLYGQYFINNNWTFAAFYTGSFGSLSSEKGSIPWEQNGVIQIKRYF